ncbi:hypothetical protein HMPREF1153_1416 [Selenomonas sp. CM52]|nr:hypothetical protein HMPREF1153_1416 [Selenomonas sp. CM52]
MLRTFDLKYCLIYLDENRRLFIMSTIVLAVSALVCATAFRLLGEEVQKG